MPGRRLNSFKLSSCNLFVIIPALGIANGSSFKSAYFWSFSVMVQGRVWLLGIAVPIQCAFLMLLPSVTMSGLLLCTVPSFFFMDLPQYTIQYHNIYSLTQNAAHISDTVSVWAETVHNSTQLVVHT